MRLETNRLILIPLTLDDLNLAIVSRRLVAIKYKLNQNIRPLNEIMTKVYKVKINNIQEDKNNYLFYTYWQLVLKQTNTIVGEIGFKSMPDQYGQIEVGYGVEPEHQRNGYMTEALHTFIDWTFLQNFVRINSILALTDKHNISSHKVLIKSGFNKYKEDGKHYYWKLHKNKYEQMLGWPI